MSRFNQVLIARIKGYLWHMFGIGLIGALTWAVQEVDLLQLSPTIEGLVTIVLGEALAQVTKYFNVNRAWVKAE
jgi:hypothetical protein